MWAAGSGDGVESWRSRSVREALCEFSLDAGTFSSWRCVWQHDPHRFTICSYEPGATLLPSPSSQPPWVWLWEFIVIAGAELLGAICTFIVGWEDTCHSSSLGFLLILWFLIYIYPLFFVQVTARLKFLSSWKIFPFTVSPYSSNSSFFFLLLMRNLLEGSFPTRI